MDSPHQPVLQACPGCAAMIDVTDLEPFEQVPCPVCQTPIRARTQFNNFTLIDVLGSGGMGAVYRALDQNLHRYVALKVVRKEYTSDPGHLASFEREARITAAVNHPNVVKVFSFGQDHGSFYIGMELVNKGSLDELIQEHKIISEAKALQIGLQIAQGLRAANQLGLIHRDIKPGNILFADEHTAKIVDFGLATVLEKETESKGEVWGTPYYVCPERLKNQPEDFRSDIYSLGATLFHAIAGKPPYESATLSVSALRQIRSRPVSLLASVPEVSSPTSAIIDRMLKEQPEDRFHSYDELIDLFSYAIGHLAAEKVDPSHSPKPERRPAKKPKFLQNVAVVAALAGAAGFAYLHYHQTGGASGDRPPVSVSKEQTLLETQYAEARGKISSGDYPAAIDLLSQVQDSPSIKPLLFRWVLFQKGVAQFLNHNYPEGEGTFAQLAEAGLYSGAPEEKVLANFFVQTGKSAAGAAPGKIKINPHPSFSQALAYFVLGLKHHQMNDDEQAEILLSAFVQSAPEDEKFSYAKLSDYKAASQNLLRELQAKKVAAPPTAELPPATPSPAAAEEQTSVKQPAEDPLVKAELEKLQGTRARFVADVAGYRFSEARKEVETLNLKSDEARKKRDLFLRVADWLTDFKKSLMGDLEREGFPFPIKATNGSVLEGGIGGASEKEIKLRTPYGVIPIEWQKVSPDSVSSMAAYFLKKEKDPKAFAEKKWGLGLYLCQFGRGKAGRPILAELAQTKPEYADALGDILELSQ